MPEEEQITLSPACPFASNLPHCAHALRARLSPIFLSRWWHCSSSKSPQTFAVDIKRAAVAGPLQQVVVSAAGGLEPVARPWCARERGGQDDGRGKARRLHFGTGSWRGCFCSVQDWTQERSARCAGAGSVGTSVALCEPTPARCRIKLLGRDDKLPTLLQSVCRWRSSRSCVIIPTLTRRH